MWKSRKSKQYIQNFGRKSKSNSSKQNLSLYQGDGCKKKPKKLLDWKKEEQEKNVDHAAARVVKKV